MTSPMQLCSNALGSRAQLEIQRYIVKSTCRCIRILLNHLFCHSHQLSSALASTYVLARADDNWSVKSTYVLLIDNIANNMDPDQSSLIRVHSACFHNKKKLLECI